MAYRLIETLQNPSKRLTFLIPGLFCLPVLMACSQGASPGALDMQRTEWREAILSCTVEEAIAVRDAHPVGILYETYPYPHIVAQQLLGPAEAGDTEAMALISGLRSTDDPNPQTLEFAERAADTGSPLALFMLGTAYKFGYWGIEPDLRLAESYLQQALDAGAAAAAFEMSELYSIDGLEPAEGDNRSSERIAFDYVLEGAALCEPSSLAQLLESTSNSDTQYDQQLTSHITMVLEALDSL